MKSKRILVHESRVECLLNCRYYSSCIVRNGKRCKHLGGNKIPKFKVPMVTSWLMSCRPQDKKVLL
jgi:hypothetical protein